MKSEQKIQSEILDYLREIGAYSIKTIITNKKGTPDIIVCYNGDFIAIEVKSDTGLVSPLQFYWMQEIRNADGIAIVAKSIDDVKKFFRSAYGEEI